jgi:hypothetical protein
LDRDDLGSEGCLGLLPRDLLDVLGPFLLQRQDEFEQTALIHAEWLQAEP